MTAPSNLLLSGRPRSGKTTIVQRVVEVLSADGFTMGGVFCPEIRRNGERVGFEIVDVMSGERATLAHVNRETGPTVGKYRVDVPSVDGMSRQALTAALEAADVIVIDEIAPMEVQSEAFVRHARRALDSEHPVLAVIQQGSTRGFIGEVTARPDVKLLEVSPENRDRLPGSIADRVRGLIGGPAGE